MTLKKLKRKFHPRVCFCSLRPSEKGYTCPRRVLSPRATSHFTIPATDSRTVLKIGGKSMAVALTAGRGAIFNIPEAVGKCTPTVGLIFPGPVHKLYSQMSL